MCNPRLLQPFSTNWQHLLQLVGISRRSNQNSMLYLLSMPRLLKAVSMDIAYICSNPTYCNKRGTKQPFVAIWGVDNFVSTDFNRSAKAKALGLAIPTQNFGENPTITHTSSVSHVTILKQHGKIPIGEWSDIIRRSSCRAIPFSSYMRDIVTTGVACSSRIFHSLI